MRIYCDLTTRADCINTDFNWYGKGDGTFNTIDYNIQNFLYNSDIYIAVGTDSEDLAVLMNPSNGFISTNTTTASAYWMTEDITYNMRVWQANSSNHYTVVPSYSSTFTPTNYPQTPGSPSIFSRFQGGLNLTWTAGDHADHYKLAYSTDNSNWTYVDNINTNSYTFYGLDGQTYYLKVRSDSNYDKPSSAYSSTSQGTTIPSIPTSISCGQATDTHTVDVSFDKGYSYSGYTVTTDIDLTYNTGAWGSPPEYVAQTGTFYNVNVTDYTTPVYFRLRAQITVSGTTLYSDWSSTKTVNLLLPQLSMPTLSFSNTTKSIACTVGANANAVNYQININGGANQTIANTGGTHTFDNLVHNTAFTIYIYANGDEVAYRDSATNSYSQSTTLLTVGNPSNITVTQNTSTHTVDLKYSWGSNATGMDFRWANDESTWNNYTNQSNNNYPSMNYTVDVLTYANKYFQIKSRRTDGYNIVYSSWYNFSPYPINVTDEPFSWTTNIVQGGNIYQTDLVNKILYIITAAEWNSFTSKINQFRNYKSLSTYSFTSVTSGTTITKAIINEAISAINDIPDRTINPPSTIITGDVINLASLYIGLKDALNSTA